MYLLSVFIIPGLALDWVYSWVGPVGLLNSFNTVVGRVESRVKGSQILYFTIFYFMTRTCRYRSVNLQYEYTNIVTSV